MHAIAWRGFPIAWRVLPIVWRVLTGERGKVPKVIAVILGGASYPK